MRPGVLRKNRRLRLSNGQTLRLLTAMEVIEARREAEELAKKDWERALCSNACLLARALERRGMPVFADGQAVLESLRVEEIGELARQWAKFNSKGKNFSRWSAEAAETLKKAWSTRRKSA